LQIQSGKTALILAALAGKADCVRLLAECGANINAKDSVRRKARGIVFLPFRYFGGEMIYQHCADRCALFSSMSELVWVISIVLSRFAIGVLSAAAAGGPLFFLQSSISALH
jgi:hypothetical protein